MTALSAGSIASPALAVDVRSEYELRSAIRYAPTGATINFTDNLVLSNDLPAITNSITINGNGHSLSGANQYRGLVVTGGVVAITNLTVRDAVARGGRGGDFYTLTAAGNAFDGGGGGGGGGAGLGGGLYVGERSKVTLTNVRFWSNSAVGGPGGGGGVWPYGGFVWAGGGGGGTAGDGGNAGYSYGGNAGAGGGGKGADSLGLSLKFMSYDDLVRAGAHAGTFGGGGGGGSTSYSVNGTSYFAYGAAPGGFGGGGGGGGTLIEGASLAGAWVDPNPAPGGFGGGSGSLPGGGGGGAGLGGAVFVQQGGDLIIAGPSSMTNNTAQGGAAGLDANDFAPAKPGRGLGSAIFLQGTGTIVFSPGLGERQVIDNSIVAQGEISGGGHYDLIKEGKGSLSLEGENSLTDRIVIRDGRLTGDSASLTANIVNQSELDFAQRTNGTYAHSLSGSGSVAKRGPGALTFTGTNPYGGATTVTGGKLLLGSASALPPASVVTLDGGMLGVESFTATIVNPIQIVATPGSGLYAGEGGRLFVNGVVSGGELVKAGSGEVTLGGTNGFKGLSVGGGVLRFTTDTNLGTAGGGIVINGGGIGTTAASASGMTINRSIDLKNNGGIDVARNGLIWGGPISGDGVFVKSGPGELTLSGTATYAGGTAINGGTLRIRSNSALGRAGSFLSIGGATLRASETFATGRPIALGLNGGTFRVDDTYTLTLDGTVSGGGLVKSGAGTLALTNAGNTYTGTTTIRDGTLVSNSAALRGDVVFDSRNDNAVVFDQAVNGAFAGSITGLGSLTKTGAGSLTLGGVNSYGDGTTVLEGTLQGTSLSLQGAITNNTAVVFDQSFDGTYAGRMTGPGTLGKNGTGKLNLTGSSSVGGGTTVNAGGLAVNGSLASNVTVNSGATLSGSGNVTGDIINNGGTVKPGNSIGRLTVNGDYTHNSGIYDVEISPNGASDRISVVGADHRVRIKAGALAVLPEAGIYAPNTTYTIITTEGGGQVRFDEVTGGAGFLRPKLSIDRNNVYLSLVLFPNSFAPAGQTANERAVGAALDAQVAKGDDGALVAAVANVPVAQGGQAFAALSGEVHASGVTAGYDQARQVQTSILSRLREPLRDAPALPAVAQGSATAYAADLPERIPSFVTVAPAPSPTGALWGEGFGSWGRARSDGNAASLETSTGGFILGADTPLGDTFRVGLAGGFAHTSFDATGRLSSGSNESVFGAIYGSGSWGAINVRLGAAYAWHDIDTTRTVLFPGFGDRASASYDGSTMQAFGEVGYRLGWGRASFEPFAGASWLRLHTQAFQEQGGLSAVSGYGRDQDLATTTLGVRGEVQVLADVPLLFKGLIGWRHAYGDVRPDMLLAFAGGASPYTVAGVPVDRNALVVEAGLDWQASQDLSLGMAYRGQLGRDAQDHALTGNLTWRFATR